MMKYLLIEEFAHDKVEKRVIYIRVDNILSIEMQDDRSSAKTPDMPYPTLPPIIAKITYDLGNGNIGDKEIKISGHSRDRLMEALNKYTINNKAT